MVYAAEIELHIPVADRVVAAATGECLEIDIRAAVLGDGYPTESGIGVSGLEDAHLGEVICGKVAERREIDIKLPIELINC